MELSELKLVSASNIIRLRNEAGITQAELGARLNYSDKTVSKWERGEAIPDAYVLKQLAEIFGVTVDYLLSSHDAWEAPTDDEQAGPSVSPRYSREKIIALVELSLWTAFIALFVLLWICGRVCWGLLLAAVPCSLLVLVILLAAFGMRRWLEPAVGVFVLSLLGLIYFAVPNMKLWQFGLLAVPAELIVLLSFNLRKKPASQENQ